MNYDELTKAIAEKFNLTFDYAQKYLPDLIERYTHYAIIQNTIFISVLAIISAIIICFLIHVFKHRNDCDSYWCSSDDNNILAYVSGAIVLAFLGILIVACINHLIQLNYVPEVYIIKHLL